MDCSVFTGVANPAGDYNDAVAPTYTHILNGSFNGTIYKADKSAGMSTNMSMTVREDPVLEGIKQYLASVVSPCLCVIGLTGNILNILVLTRRRMQSAIDCSMERAAYMGLIALAVSDMLYCLCTFPDAFMGRQQVVFTSRNFWLYYMICGKYLQNLFSHISTWLTLIMAGGRYAAICHPLHARQFVHVKGTRIAMVLVFLIWTSLGLPILWTYAVHELPCSNGSVIYILDQGSFARNKAWKLTFSYIWSVFGYLVPVCVLAFCNTHLIRALRESYRMRQEYRVHGRTQQPGSRITPTLIAIVVMFLVLVSPSEVIQFIFYTIEGSSVEHLNVAIHVTNILHTLNFAINFVLYCCVNSHFRDTLKDICCCVGRSKGRLNRNVTYTATYSNVTTKTYAAPSASETVL